MLPRSTRRLPSSHFDGSAARSSPCLAVEAHYDSVAESAVFSTSILASAKFSRALPASRDLRRSRPTSVPGTRRCCAIWHRGRTPERLRRSRRGPRRKALRTISTFSCDIARAVSRRLRSRRERLAPTAPRLRGPHWSLEELAARDLRVAELPKIRGVRRDVDAADRALRADDHRGHEAVVSALDLVLEFDPVLVPCVPYRSADPDHFGTSSVDALERPLSFEKSSSASSLM